MSKAIRLQISITVIAHVGDDLSERDVPLREPDACTATRLVRFAECGTMVHVADAASSHIAGVMANTAPVLAERVRHELKQKDL